MPRMLVPDNYEREVRLDVTFRTKNPRETFRFFVMKLIMMFTAVGRSVTVSPIRNTPVNELGVKDAVLDELAEKEVMIDAYDKIRKMFQRREWIMEGRGFYPYNDDRYKEEVRNMYDEFLKINDDVWKNIKTKSFEFRAKAVGYYLETLPKINLDPEIQDAANKILNHIKKQTDEKK